jgi:hypothetical protein
MKILHTVLLAALLQAISCAEFWPDVPDPVGLGPRLALIDWLRERQTKIPPNASDGELVELWRQASGIAAQEQAQRAADHDAQVQADRAKREALDRERSDTAVKEAVAGVPEHIQERRAGTPEGVAAQPPAPRSPPTASAPSAPPATKPKTSPKESTGASTPDPQIGNLREWAANWASPPSSTRTATTVSVYTRHGDTTYYYLVTEQPKTIKTDLQKKQASARITIDGEDFGIASPGLRRVKPQTFRPSPQISLIAP